MKRAGAAEQPEQSGDNQVDGNDVVEQPRHDQNENAGDQRNERGESEIHMHHGLLWLGAPVPTYRNNFSAFSSVFMTPHKRGIPTATHSTASLTFTAGCSRGS